MSAPFLALLVAFAALGSDPAAAQTLNFGGRAGAGPIEILARDGIEWRRDDKRYVARGEARAKQGDTTIAADVLTAHYRDKAHGGTEIHRFEAVGNVRIDNAVQTAWGENAVYDVDSGVVVLKGRGLKLVTPQQQITARDSLEYWEGKRMAVARGDALVVNQDKRMRGDVLTAYFAPLAAPPPPPRPPAASRPAAGRAPAPAPAAGGDRLQRVEGFGNLLIVSATEVASGERGVYNAETGIAILAGSVKLTRGENQLNGDYAEIDLNTGVSRLLARPERGGDAQVRALFTPEDKAKSPAATAPRRPPERAP